MKKCEACGAINADNAVFCNICGTKFESKIELVQQTYDTFVENEFLLPIEDVFYVGNKGTVVVGQIVDGKVAMNDIVYVIFDDGRTIQSEVVGIEMSQKTLNEAQTGDGVGVVLKNVKKEDIIDAKAIAGRKNNVLHKNFTAHILLYQRETKPIFNYYHPGMIFASPKAKLESKGTMSFVDSGIELLKPGEETDVTITLDKPCVLTKGMSFGFHEGGSKFVGSGTITSIIESDENIRKPILSQEPVQQPIQQPVQQPISQPQTQIQALDDFFENLLKEKGLTNLEPTVKAEMIKEMTNLLMDQINKASIMKLSEEKADELARLIDDPNFTNEKMTKFMVNSGVNLSEVAVETMLKFRELYLGEK